MTPANLRLTAIFYCLLMSFCGCGQSDQASPLTSDNDDLLSELLGTDNSDSDAVAAESSESAVKTVSSGSQIQGTEGDTSDSIVDDILGRRNDDSGSVTTALVTRRSLNPTADSVRGSSSESIQLNVGDQFPFVKTIRQNVVQTSTNRSTMVQNVLNAETQMQLTMNVSVQNTTASGFVCEVRYLRVQYVQNIDGQQQSYDSATSEGASVPKGLEAYAGMVGNGFRFNLSGQNQIESTDGLSAFLDQCVAASPFDQRVSTRATLEQRFQNGAVTELVDESMGLLPYGSSRPQAGDVWMIDRNLQQQSPITLTTTCRLASINGTNAEVELMGRFESSSTDGSFRISDGRTMGACLIDLVSGMPVHGHRSSYLKVVSEQPTALIEITKRIESTFASQNQSARLLVQQQESAAAAVRQMMPAASPAMANPAAAARSASLPQGYPNNSPSGSAFNAMPSRSGVGVVGSASPVGNMGPGYPVQPVSSSNPSAGQPSAAPLPIPGGVPVDNLKSTAEAIYPE